MTSTKRKRLWVERGMPLPGDVIDASTKTTTMSLRIYDEAFADSAAYTVSTRNRSLKLLVVAVAGNWLDWMFVLSDRGHIGWIRTESLSWYDLLKQG